MTHRSDNTPSLNRSMTVDLDQRLIAIFEAVLGPDASALSDQAGPGSIEAWDSVNHLNLILAIEAEFGIQFDTAEIPDLLSRATLRARLAQVA